MRKNTFLSTELEEHNLTSPFFWTLRLHWVYCFYSLCRITLYICHLSFDFQCSFIFFITVLLRNNWHRINWRYLKSIIWWLVTYVYDHEIMTMIKTMNISIIPRGFLIPLCNPFLSLFSSLPHLQAATDLLSVTMDCFSFSIIPYKWNHKACLFFAQLFLLSIIILRFTYVVVFINNRSLLFPFHWFFKLFIFYFIHFCLDFWHFFSSNYFGFNFPIFS